MQSNTPFQQFVELLKHHNVLPQDHDHTSMEHLFNETRELLSANAKDKTKAQAKAKAKPETVPQPHTPASEEANELDENCRLMAAYRAHDQQKRLKWRSQMPSLDISEDAWDEIYNKIISDHQGNMQANGAFFE